MKNNACANPAPTEESSAEELGMYAMHEMKPGTVRIGDFVLCKQSEGKIWIQHDSGEGGEFSEDALHATLKKHYDEYF